MDQNIEEVSTQKSSEYVEYIEIVIGTTVIRESIPIICPNQENDIISHSIKRNGHDTGSKKEPQQYQCKICSKSFYGHTSREVKALCHRLRSILSNQLKNGKLNSGTISTSLNVSQATASRILHRILKAIPESPKFHDLKSKHRNSSTLIIDETFLKIGGKTWYLIVVLSGNQKIMDFRLVRSRSVEVILEMVSDCASRLNYSLKLMVTDGFQVYMGVAFQLKRNIIHVRHIHKPPYGRVEVDIYTVGDHEVDIVHVESCVDISVYPGYFLATAESHSRSYGTKKRGRKSGGKNRPKESIEQEKAAKKKANRKRGHPKGVKNKQRSKDLQVFYHNKKEGCVRAVSGSSEQIARAFSRVFRQFAGKSITTNLVENVFSVLKKLINFRGNRTIEGWQQLLTGYFAIRDDPKLLSEVVKSIKLNPSLVLSYYQGIGMKILEVGGVMGG